MSDSVGDSRKFRRGKRRIMKEFVMNELSAVDVPAQAGARAVIAKRAVEPVAISKALPRLASMPKPDDPAWQAILDLSDRLKNRKLDMGATAALRLLLATAMADLGARHGVAGVEKPKLPAKPPSDAEVRERMARAMDKAGDPRAELAALLGGGK